MVAKTSLSMNQLELSVHLGWPKEERLQKQIVFLDLNVFFSEPPKACFTDDLADTVCYAELAKQIQESVSQHPFHLVEHLTYAIYHLIKSRFPKDAVHIRLTKNPLIPGLKSGICFCYGDRS